MNSVTLHTAALFCLLAAAFLMGIGSVFGGIALTARIQKDRHAGMAFEGLMTICFVVAMMLMYRAVQF